ncbi:TetR/AcrR family transcriptional regulator [Streptacidiphilus sp. N1-3]|uniref:TetR/AcrR family transcriptional regulator n=1 Tax=Streptacidiphilus alkalitolerans TaxID=3342712 RepID=A0ABV6WXB4_9ACTN
MTTPETPTITAATEGSAAPAAPAAPESRVPGAASRDRLLDAAAGLFYRDGVGIGVEALCKAAGVSKRSMYQLFGSKDEVLAASLERSGPAYQELLLPAPDDPRPPRALMLHVFERLDALSATSEYQGCPFVSTATEIKDPGHPASLVARRYKQALTAFFHAQAARAGVSDPETLARQLTIVFDGAGARTVVQDQPLDGLATATALVLLNAAGLTDAAQSASDSSDSASAEGERVRAQAG